MRALFRSRSKGIIDSRLRLYPDALLATEIDLPDLAIQQAIADFLDRETARIDQLIEKKRLMAALIAERKSAAVEDATNVGISTRLKHLKTFITSGSRGWAEFYADEGSTFLRITNVTGPGIDVDLSDLAFVKLPANAEGVRTRVQAGDLLISITAELGAVAVADGLCEGAYVNQHLALVRLNRHRADPRFVAYALTNNHADDQFRMMGYGGTKQGLSLFDVGEVAVHLPALDEQVRIRTSLDEVCSRFRELQSRVQRSIDRLPELRAALITAAVTGQIDGATWGKRGETGRQLDTIEADVAAATQPERQQARA